MTLLSMRFRQKIAKVFVAVFLLGAVFGISWELVLAQKKVNDLGSAISRGPLPSLLKGIPRLDEIQWRLERHRVSRGFERLELYNGTGHKLAESPPGEHGVIHGVLTSVRAGVRDPASGREVAHLVVWRNMEAEAARPLLAGLIAGLLAVLIAWPLYLRKLGGEL